MHAAPGLTSKEAYVIASEWGSFMQAGDPGACLYGFHFNDCRPQSETHRRECLAHIEGFCLKLVLWEFIAARASGNSRMAHEAIRDWRSLVLLHRFLRSADLYPIMRKPRRLAA